MQSNQVLDVLCTRLRLGGQWFMPGDAVLLDETDAAVYRSRGLSSPAPAGAVAKNAPSVPAAKMGLVVKAAEETEVVIVEAEEKSVYHANTGARHGKRAR